MTDRRPFVPSFAGLSGLVLAATLMPAPGAGAGRVWPAPSAPAPAEVRTVADTEAALALARRIQTHYDGVRDFTARFEQVYVGGVLRKRTSEQGTVAIRKPGLMRWEYTSPEPKLFVSDGRMIYSYVPADRQVMVQPLPQGDRASTPVMFLAGKGSLVRDFTMTEVTGDTFPRGTRALKLVPKRTEAGYEWLTLVVDADSLEIRQLVARDGQGGTSTFTFTGMRENAGVDTDRFEFDIPRGVTVIRNQE